QSRVNTGFYWKLLTRIHFFSEAGFRSLDINLTSISGTSSFLEHSLRKAHSLIPEVLEVGM
ncbi:MAG: hypothetical protein JXK93_12185, partial [Sphaerochaetaceae bacterium]|nr:hypothetical protein [Sphaerochaetaceae bacterium]